jgi:hypothetical protein
MCDDVQLCDCCVCEFLILARTWFAVDLPSKTGCNSLSLVQQIKGERCLRTNVGDLTTCTDVDKSGF